MPDPAIVAAIVALITSVISAAVVVAGQRNLRLLEAEIKERENTAAFLAEKLTQFYLPMALHLQTTRKLFERYLQAGEGEKEAIEHELRLHNSAIRHTLLQRSALAEPDTPDEMLDGLLEHLTQWEIVYDLKYKYHVYDGPVFAGIETFGFKGFPQGGLDRHFRDKARDLRHRYHNKLTARAAAGRP